MFLSNERPGRSHRSSERKRTVILLVSMVTLLVSVGAIYFKRTQGHGPENTSGTSLQQPERAELQDQDNENRCLVVGTWEDHYEGKRTMTLKEDGTGTMVVELRGLKAALAAPRLRFDMTWTVEGGRLKKQTVGGEPANTVQLILKTMGDRVDEPILELNQGLGRVGAAVVGAFGEIAGPGFVGALGDVGDHRWGVHHVARVDVGLAV